MKKLIIAAVAVVAAWAVAPAQQLPYFGEQPRVAVSASIDIGKPVTNHSEWFPGYDTGLGLSVGALYNLPLGGHFYFEPSAEIYYHSWSNDSYAWGWIDDVNHGGLGDPYTDFDYYSIGVTVPVQVGYRMVFPDCGLSIATGLAPRLGLRGRAETKEKVYEGEHTFSEPLYGDDGFLRRAEVALPLSMTVDYGRWLFGVRVMLGLTNVSVKNDLGLRTHNRSFALRVAYAL